MKVKESKVKVFTIEYDIDENGRPNSQMTINNVKFKCSQKANTTLQLIEHGITKSFKGSVPTSSKKHSGSPLKSTHSKVAWDENFSKDSDTRKYTPLRLNNASLLTKRLFSNFASKIKEFLLIRIFSLILIPSFAILYSMIVTLWPQHNIILHPEYWYEPIAPFLLGYILIVTATGIVDCSMVLRTDFILSWKAFITIFVAHSIGFLFPYISIYVIWVYILEFRYPMPFTGHLCYLVGSLFKGMQLWFYFPYEWRTKNQRFRKRLLAYLSFFPLQIVLAQGLSLLVLLFFKVPLNM